MPTHETALILVQPDDSTDTVLEKMLRSGATSVQLLVPEGAIGLRTVAQASRLRQMAEWSWIDLTLVSSDPATIGAAWINQIQILVVCDTQVLAALPPPRPPVAVDEQPAAPVPDAAVDGPAATRVPDAAIDEPPPAQTHEPSPLAARPEPPAPRRPEPAIAPAHPRRQRGAAPGQRADRVLPPGAVPRLTRREPARPRPPGRAKKVR